MTITTTTDMPALIEQSLMPGYLSVPTPYFNYNIFAEKYAMPLHGGTTARFVRPRALRPPVEKLGNAGIEPPSQVLGRDIIDAQGDFYGTSVILNEQLLIQNQDSALALATERLAVAGKEAEDIIMRDFMVSTATTFNCTNGTNGLTVTEAVANDFYAQDTILATNNAPMFMSGIPGADRFGTGPVRAAYVMLAHTNLRNEFNRLDKFINMWNYPNPNEALVSEFGSIGNFRILTSSNGAIQKGGASDGTDLYQSIVLSQESVAHIQQDGYSCQLQYRDRRFSGPLGLNASLGLSFFMAMAVLQDTRISNFQSTLSA